jgi:hypothetical protein
VSLSKDELLNLMAYADGEVEGSTLSEVEALVARNDDAKRFLEQQGALRQWAVDSRGWNASAGGADGIANTVMARIAEMGGVTVIALERERAKRERNRRRFVPFGALAAVAATFALLYFWSRGASDRPASVAVQERKTVDFASAPAAASPALPSAAAVASIDPSEEPVIDIQAVESPQHQFSIFYVPGSTGANAYASSVVVWIGEE